MVTTFIFFIAGLFYFYKESEEGSLIMSIIGGLFGVLIGLIVTLLLSSMIPAKNEMVLDSKYNIVSMNLANNSLSGNFFIGTGTVGNVPKYIFYYKSSDGFIRLKQIDYTNVRIKWGPPSVKMYKSKPTDDFINYFLLSKNVTEWEIQVPEGSIKPIIDINLK
jgi:hypothetical protein